MAQTPSTIAYHVDHGAVDMHYPVDVNHAVSRHPDEWSRTPWEPGVAAEARKRLHERRVAAAQAAGEDPPGPYVEPVIADEDRAEFEEWKAARAKAKAVLDAAAKEKAEQDKKVAAIAEAEAVIATPPPRPDPARRPLTGAAKANAERTAAKAAAEKPAPQPTTAPAVAPTVAAAKPGDGT